MNEQNVRVDADDLKRVVLEVLDDMKAQDVRVLDVRRLTDVTDAMIIASGTSDRHVKSMADRIRDRVKEALDLRPIGVEGEREADWILIDLGDVVVHLMRPETREYYDLERLWNRDVEELVRLNREQPEQG
jgi:ribosome-associated protein